MKSYCGSVSTTEMYRMATEDFMTLEEIASVVGISKQAISQRFQRAGLVLRRAPYHGRNNPILTNREALLEHLGKFTHYELAIKPLKTTYQVLKRWIKFHSIVWKYDYHGKNATNWNGGRFADKKGYIWLNCHENKYLEFNPEWKSHQVYEHKFVVETKRLGAPHPDGYIVHHINQKKEDNDINNLALLTVAQHMKVHEILDKIHEATSCKRAWRSHLLTTYNQLVKSVSDANINLIRIERAMNSEGSMDELATLTFEESKKDWAKRKRYSLEELLKAVL